MTGASPAMTIEQVASEIGLPYSTIRMYQHKGLLPPPARRGRVAYYGPDHLARLRLIGQLQDRGYSLAAIKDLVDTWQDGRTLADVLELESRVARAFEAEPALRLRPDELLAHFGDVTLTPDDLQRAYSLQLIAFDGDAIVVRSPTFLEVGSTLARMGIPVGEILDEYEHLRAIAEDLAAHFTAVFERNLWKPFAEAGMPADQLATVTDSLGRLGPLAERVVQSTLREALRTSTDQFLAERAKDLEASGSRGTRDGRATPRKGRKR